MRRRRAAGDRPAPGQRPAVVVVVGGGFAGLFAARTLERLLPPEAADLTLISATDHLCYSPLLPEVAAGRLDPRRIAVPLRAVLHRTRVVQASVEDVDFGRRTLRVVADHGPVDPVHWDRVALTTGSVTRTLPTPGVATYALGLKTLVEAQYLHDHVLRQLELADGARDPVERRARLTFVAVGAGYTGTETAAQLQHMTTTQRDRFPRLRSEDLRWVLIDVAPTILPELGARFGRAAMQVVRARGMEIRLGTSVTAMHHRSVSLSDGDTLPTHTVVWTVGVTPPPLVRHLGLPVRRGRLAVDDHLQLRDGVWAAGDSAAARDPFSGTDADYPPTAQHAQRQGVVIARNIAASLGHGSPRTYRHRDLGLVADLGGASGVARPLGLPLTGPAAKVVTKGYHLYALPSAANRLRIGADWLTNLVSRPIAAQVGLVEPEAARLAREQPGAGAVGHPVTGSASDGEPIAPA
ncbi:NAD(P)/FAD-dependent oxidoreductase [Blastococcus sp. TF02-09]|nr:NAD(P)/FAD-dependent oxidoreductase [Blastococcus sp. TF02-9]